MDIFYKFTELISSLVVNNNFGGGFLYLEFSGAELSKAMKTRLILLMIGKLLLMAVALRSGRLMLLDTW